MNADEKYAARAAEREANSHADDDTAFVNSLPAVCQMRVCDIQPSPENDDTYKPVDPTDPSIIAMAESMRERGVLEPLVITMDCYILSGHRRYAAAKLAGLDVVPCRVEPILRDDDIDAFVVLLCQYNKDQRVKSLDEQVREAVVCGNPEDAYAELADHRREKAKGTMRAFG